MSEEKRKSFWKFFLTFLAIIVAVLSFQVAVAKYGEWRDRKQVQTVQDFFSDYDTAMRADNFGGSTPEDTLRLFIEALKSGDMMMAANYVELETRPSDPNYLTHKNTENALLEVQKDGNLQAIIELIEKAEPAGSSIEGYFGYEVKNENGEVLIDIGLRLNEYSRVWKITSL